MRGPRVPMRPSVQVRTLIAVLAWAMTVTACGTPAATPDTQPQPATVEVEVFFANSTLGDPCGEVFPVSRAVGADEVVRGTLEALLAGPTASEQAAGYGGWFSPDTAGALLQVEVVEQVAYVVFTDLRQLIPNASSSCGSAGLLAQLDKTLLGLEGVTATRYALPDEAAFYNWLQFDVPDGTEPVQDVDLAAGWTRIDDFQWPVTVGCCGAPVTGPASPPGDLPVTGWPDDGFYDLEVVRPAEDPTVLRMTIRRWLRLEDLPEMWEGETDVLVADTDQVIERQVALADLDVVLLPIEPFALLGEPGALTRLLDGGLDPAYRTWVYEPSQLDLSLEAIEADLLARSQHPTFPFGLDYVTEMYDGAPIAFRGPLGSSLLADPTWTRNVWPPGANGLYGWPAVTLEVREGRPILYLWAGQIGG